jgi:hypothetical protein
MIIELDDKNYTYMKSTTDYIADDDDDDDAVCG